MCSSAEAAEEGREDITPTSLLRQGRRKPSFFSPYPPPLPKIHYTPGTANKYDRFFLSLADAAGAGGGAAVV